VICDPADADLYVNGKQRKSKSQMFPEGEYRAVLKSPGYEDYGFIINLPSKTEYNIKMKRLKYSIAFNPEKGMEPGIEVYEDDKLLGTMEKNGLVLNLDSGGHILTFKKRGYDDRVETYSFSQNRSYAIKLKKSIYDLNINSSEAGTQVYINGKQSGKAPFTKKLEYGKYKVRVEKEGFLTEEKEITLDKNYALNFSLREKKFVEFRVETNPQGADVYFGGKKRGTAPGTFQFPEGDVKIEVVYEGIRLDKDITLRPGGKAQVVSFDFKYCTFKVESNPAEVDVYINGKKAGITPGSFTVPEGEVWVKVESAGKKREKTVTLKYGAREQNLSFDFTKSEYRTGQIEKFGNIEMVYIEGGTFTMGSPESEWDRRNNEKQHKVTVSPFLMGKFEVTQKEYLDIMGTNPSRFKGDNLPVEQVSWYNAVAYCNRLSRKHGFKLYYNIDTCIKDPFNKNEYDKFKWSVTIVGGSGFRLPTEAEWEYACRAGTITVHYWGNSPDYDGVYSWRNSNSSSFFSKRKTQPVGQKKPNAWGVYDMSGNVKEWCWDWYEEWYYNRSPVNNPKGAESGECRVLRGGSAISDEFLLRSAARDRYLPDNTLMNNEIGFRVVRSAE
jgi:formylglycine-generating enzyme required for sulfatase activity